MTFPDLAVRRDQWRRRYRNPPKKRATDHIMIVEWPPSPSLWQFDDDGKHRLLARAEAHPRQRHLDDCPWKA